MPKWEYEGKTFNTKEAALNAVRDDVREYGLINLYHRFVEYVSYVGFSNIWKELSETTQVKIFNAAVDVWAEEIKEIPDESEEG